MAGERHATRLYDREEMKPGCRVRGPAVVIEANATTVVEPGWAAEVNRFDQMILTRVVPRPGQASVGTEVDPVMLEVFNNLFMSIAEQMGVVLQNTSYSVNIKERLDFSCAIFGPDGSLVANAPHIPVHLGSMSESVRTVSEQRAGTIVPGDVFMLNTPYNGGTHLPDVTVITPVFDDAGEAILFYVAARGHHADIGGTTPGSVPPDSKHIDEEGVLIDNFQLVSGGRLLEKETEALFTGAPYPTRNFKNNLADLKAHIAGNEKGVQELRKMVAHFGLDVVHAYMKHVQDNAEECVRRVLGVLTDGAYEYEMDSGARICVEIEVDRENREAIIDFTGTSAQQNSNFNAPSSVCMAAVLYVFRLMVDDEIPLNAGCLEPLRVIIPEGCMLAPRYPAAVVAGNVETSQAVTNALIGALGIMGAGQGTMNNFTFGDNAGLPELRDHLRRRRRGTRLRRRPCRAHPYDQHAGDRPRDPRMALPGGAGVVLDPRRLGRRRRAEGGQRDRPQGAVPGADDGGDRLQPPPRAALRHGGRPAGQDGPQLCRARRRHDRRAHRHRHDADERGRPVRHRNPGRRRLRPANLARVPRERSTLRGSARPRMRGSPAPRCHPGTSPG